MGFGIGAWGGIGEADVGGPADTTPPEVSNPTPTPGTLIEASTPIGADVTDNSGAFRRILLAVRYSVSGIVELVHDGSSFVGPYQVASTRAPITRGFRYRLLRDGGWPSSPTLIAYAFDLSGNEA